MDTIRNPITYEETIKLEHCRSEYPNATHYVWAYVLREENGRLCIRFSDDGEPRNSAGKPTLSPIQGRELMNTAVVVIRYFGGIKLGVGGLIRAYGGVAAETLNLAGRKPITRRTSHTLEVEYKDLATLERQLGDEGAVITRKTFTDKVEVTYEVEDEV
jgi:uncharacterized YigZ family protein